MKYKRQSRILKVINEQQVSTQEELTQVLKEDGFEVTQATVSRDIKELGLIKVPATSGRYKYASAIRTGGEHEKHLDVFSGTVIKTACALHTIVINTFPGMAQAVAASLDFMISGEILGSIAGDDTLLLICENEVCANELYEKINKMFRA